MKQQLPATTHDRHDAMLIVRLYDGDVSERERAQATSLVEGCGECAQLFADLASISTATRAMPTPPRPRDFFLTEADAVRLGRPDGTPVHAPGRLAWSNLRRSFGAALAGLGLAGVLLTGATTFLTASNTTRLTTAGNADSNGQPAAAPAVPLASSSDLALQTAAPQQLGPANGAATPATGSVSAAQPSPHEAASPATDASMPSPASATPAPATAAPAATAAAAATTAASPGNKSAATAQVPGDGQVVVAGPSGGDVYNNGTGGSTESAGGSTRAANGSTSALDPAAIAFAGFGIALGLGLALLAGPAVLRRIRRTGTTRRTR